MSRLIDDLIEMQEMTERIKCYALIAALLALIVGVGAWFYVIAHFAIKYW